MRSRAAKLAGLAAGRYTPFLTASWGPEEREIVERRRRGERFPAAADELAHALAAGYGPGWHALPTNLGRTAIQLVLEALELPPASEVLLPSYACSGVIVPVLQAGHRPVLIDSDGELNPSYESVLAADSPDVRAIVLPHFAGNWARDADAIVAWAETRDVAVVEDVAQAQGLRRDGAPAGSFGVAAVVSFGGGKMLFGPGGGAVLTRDEALAGRLRRRALREEPDARVGSRVEQFRARFDVSSRARARRALRDVLTQRLRPTTAPAADVADPHGFEPLAISGVEAALALTQLRKLDAIVEAHRASAARWRDALAGRDDLALPPFEDNVFTKLWLRAEGGADAALAIRSAFHRAGVETETLYVPLGRRTEFAAARSVATPNTDAAWPSVFALPARPGLGDGDWARIADAVRGLP